MTKTKQVMPTRVAWMRYCKWRKSLKRAPDFGKDYPEWAIGTDYAIDDFESEETRDKKNVDPIPSGRVLFAAFRDLFKTQELIREFAGRSDLHFIYVDMFARLARLELGGEPVSDYNSQTKHILYSTCELSAFTQPERSAETKAGLCKIMNEWAMLGEDRTGGPKRVAGTVYLNAKQEHPIKLNLDPEYVFNLEGLFGPDAIDRFFERMFDKIEYIVSGRDGHQLDDIEWLRSPSALSDKPLTFDGGDKGKRKQRLDQAHKLLFESKLKRRIVNAYSSEMRGGLTAFATELCLPQLSDRKRDIPCCYIPLQGRGKKPSGERFSDLLLRIFNFYLKINGEEDRQIEPEVFRRFDLDETVEVIEAIRAMMLRRPGVLIFDGYRAARYAGLERNTNRSSLKHLVAAVAEDRLFEVLERIYAVPTAVNKEGFDLTKFDRNRCLILSDRRLYGTEAGKKKPLHPHPFLSYTPGLSMDIPRPKKTDGLIKTFGNQSAEQLAIINKEFSLDQTGLMGLPSKQRTHARDLVAYSEDYFTRRPTAESIFGVMSVLLMLGHNRKTDATSPADTQQTLKRLIEYELIPAILDTGSRKRWMLFLAFLAIAPGGLRPRTLVRVSELYLQLFEADCQDASDRASLSQHVGEFLKACNGMVGLCRTDSLRAVTGCDLPTNWQNELITGQDEVDLDRAIMFAFEDYRLIFMEHLKGLNKLDEEGLGSFEGDGKQFLSQLHSLLAEEAYAQHLYSTRYDTRQSDGALDRKARLVTAIYHGVASLGDHELSDRFQVKAPRGESYLPEAPNDRWIVLYGSFFQTQLENHPSMELVNRHDVGELRHDILQFFARPQSWYDLRDGKSDQIARPKVHDVAEHVETGNYLVRSFFKSLLRSREATGRPFPDPSAQEKIVRELLGTPKDAPGTSWPQWLIEDQTSDVSESDRAFLFDIVVERLAARRSPSGVEPEAVYGAMLDRITDADAAKVSLEDTLDGLRKIARSTVEHCEPLEEPLSKIADIWASSFVALAPDEEPIKRNERLKHAITYLNLAGEALGWEADKIQSDIKDAKGRKDRDLDPSEDNPFWDLLTRSFAAFYLADRLRSRSFGESPLGRVDAMTGRSGRGFVRICLKLGGLQHRYLRWIGNPILGNWEFGSLARKASTEMASYVSRVARDRAGLLIVDTLSARYSAATHIAKADIEDSDLATSANQEAQLARIHRTLRERSGILIAAYQILHEAEKTILSLGMHGRVYFRFLLERAHILTELARVNAPLEKSEPAPVVNENGHSHRVAVSPKLLLNLAKRDADVVAALADHNEGPWGKLISARIDKIDLVRKEINERKLQGLTAMD